MSETKLNVEKRTNSGKNYSRAIRRDGKVPGVYYYHGEDAVPLIIEARELKKLVSSKPALISLHLEGDSPKEAVIREVQREPVSGEIRHVDFMGIKRGVKITVLVPIHIFGEAEGIKEGGILEHLIRELEIECLPKHIPDKLDVDITKLQIGDSLHVSGLEYENITILTNEETTIVSVKIPKAMISEAVTDEEEVEGEEVEGEEAVAEGEKPEPEKEQ